MTNFTFQDIIGCLLAFSLFSLIFVAPGYITGWMLDLFEFNRRSSAARFVIAIVLSMAVCPILLFWVYYFTSAITTISLLLLIGILFAILLLKTRQAPLTGESKRFYRIALLVAGGWIIFSLLLLVDIQVGSRLYFPNVAYDYTTRITVINAIARTGVPPVNPSYFPGHPEKLTYLYYYWYILPSIIDRVGGNFVNSRQAMIAGTIWSGICLISVIGLYLRIRNKNGKNSWIAPLIGIQLLAISGLDFIPVVAIDLRARQALGSMVFQGQIEGWNMPITSWLNAITWVPNHISAAIECITAMLVILTTDQSDQKKLMTAGCFREYVSPQLLALPHGLRSCLPQHGLYGHVYCSVQKVKGIFFGHGRSWVLRPRVIHSFRPRFIQSCSRKLDGYSSGCFLCSTALSRSVFDPEGTPVMGQSTFITCELFIGAGIIFYLGALPASARQRLQKIRSPIHRCRDNFASCCGRYAFLPLFDHRTSQRPRNSRMVFGAIRPFGLGNRCNPKMA